jgi:hypothetical protein
LKPSNQPTNQKSLHFGNYDLKCLFYGEIFLTIGRLYSSLKKKSVQVIFTTMGGGDAQSKVKEQQLQLYRYLILFTRAKNNNPFSL